MDNFINPKDLLYPIGSVYISKYDGLNNCTSHNPASVFGGTWLQVMTNTEDLVDFYNFNENTDLKEKVKYYVRVA